MKTEVPVWFVTGCSSGLGRALAEAIVARGHACVATARDASSVDALVRRAPERVLALTLDTTDIPAIAPAVDAALARFGRIDRLVNNAGYGYYAAVEEGEDAEMRRQFDTNVFGPTELIRRVLPQMRARRHGHIFNVSSVAGLIGYAGSGYYAASKFALEGLSEALAHEVKEFDLHVTLVEPGPFRTQFQGPSKRVAATPIAAYARTAIARREQLQASVGTQAGDPERAAAIMMEVAESAAPPLRLVLGKSGFDRVVEKLDAEVAAIRPLKALAYSADFPEAS